MPQSIGIFTSLFKQEGYILDLFDCTYYQDIDTLTLGKNTNEERLKIEMFINTTTRSGMKKVLSLKMVLLKILKKF